MIISKPKIFISSTIYDFRDLRSALKFWLERLGYQVLLSEFNDFTKPLDENSLNACFQVVNQSDYYILFIGSRVGGLYNSQEKVSITQMEYRTAYELMKSQKLKVIIFIREELWKIKSDRKALRDFLETDLATQKEISSSEANRIINHTSDIVNDADAIFGFIEEVTRATEMKDAIEGKGPFPKGNWVHTYSIFQDITDVLSIELGITNSLSQVALIENLKHELYSNLIYLTEKSDGAINLSCRWALFAKQHLVGEYDSASEMPARHLRWLAIFAFTGGTSYKLSTRFIEQALISGEFLEYSSDLGRYYSGAINNLLFDLQTNIDRLNFMENSLSEALVNFEEKYRELSKSNGNVSIINSDLVKPLAVADCQHNIVALTVALIKALDGDISALSSLTLNPTSPIPIEADKIKSETATLEEIIKWVNEQ